MLSKSNKLLILDLDETLIFSSLIKLSHESDFMFDKYFVYRRPFLDNFLSNLAEHFSIGIWSSAGDIYVEAIAKQIKPDNVSFDFVWGRSKCTLKRNMELDTYEHEKRLSKLKKKGYLLESMIIVDDTPEKSRTNYGNAAQIKAFTGNADDRELRQLQNYLISIKDVPNVRTIEKRNWLK